MNQLMDTATLNAVPKCQWCGMLHGAKCPTVKAFEYHPDGSLKRVEFHDPQQGWLSDIKPGQFGPAFGAAAPLVPTPADTYVTGGGPVGPALIHRN